MKWETRWEYSAIISYHSWKEWYWTFLLRYLTLYHFLQGYSTEVFYRDILFSIEIFHTTFYRDIFQLCFIYDTLWDCLLLFTRISHSTGVFYFLLGCLSYNFPTNILCSTFLRCFAFYRGVFYRDLFIKNKTWFCYLSRVLNRHWFLH